MATITDVYESARGCGWRKSGGIYIRSDGLFDSCGKLPLRLNCCPACGQGVKVTRGMSKINPRRLFENQFCGQAEELHGPCDSCPISTGNIKTVGYLMGVGERFYKTPAHFIREALEMGVSKRIHQIPRDFEVGVTPVFLAHPKVFVDLVNEEAEDQDFDEDAETLDLDFHSGTTGKRVVKHSPGVIAVVVPNRIEYVVSGDESEEQLEALEKRGLKLVRVHKVTEVQAEMEV